MASGTLFSHAFVPYMQRLFGQKSCRDLGLVLKFDERSLKEILLCVLVSLPTANYLQDSITVYWVVCKYIFSVVEKNESWWNSIISGLDQS